MSSSHLPTTRPFSIPPKHISNRERLLKVTKGLWKEKQGVPALNFPVLLMLKPHKRLCVMSLEWRIKACHWACIGDHKIRMSDFIGWWFRLMRSIRLANKRAVIHFLESTLRATRRAWSRARNLRTSCSALKKIRWKLFIPMLVLEVWGLVVLLFRGSSRSTTLTSPITTASLTMRDSNCFLGRGPSLSKLINHRLMSHLSQLQKISKHQY